jgi:hypothetical protein
VLDPGDTTGPPASKHESIDKEATHVLSEVRMVIPGVQALFGFQLVAVYNSSFRELLSDGEQKLHLLSLVLTAITIALLMAPAAYHRQAEPHRISYWFLRLSSLMIAVGMSTLMLSILLDCYLIARLILHDRKTSAFIAAALGVVYVGLWFVVPQLMRRWLRPSASHPRSAASSDSHPASES